MPRKKKPPILERLVPTLTAIIARFRRTRSKIVDFTIPALPSKKNGRVGHRPKPEATQSQNALKDALHCCGLAEGPLFPSEDVEVHLVYDPKGDLVRVRVRELGAKNEDFYDRRRDIQNLTETICDAMEGPVYNNDNQVARVVIERLRTDEGESLEPEVA